MDNLADASGPPDRERQLHPARAAMLYHRYNTLKEGEKNKKRKDIQEEAWNYTAAAPVSVSHAPLLIRLICPSWMLWPHATAAG